MNPEIIKITKHWLKEKYFDFMPTFAMEKLDENQGIKLSDEKVRQIITGIGLWKPRTQKEKQRLWELETKKGLLWRDGTIWWLLLRLV